MNTEDTYIKKKIDQDSNSEISVPSWETMSFSVKKQNFFSFGFRHLNIYLIILASCVISLGVWGYSLFNQSNSTETIHPIENEYIIEESNIETKPETIDSIYTDIIENHTIEVSVPPIQTKTNIVEPQQTAHKKDTLLKYPNQEAAPPFIMPIEDSTISKKTATKGKTIIVFETDTVIKYDTLMVDKRRRFRR